MWRNKKEYVRNMKEYIENMKEYEDICWYIGSYLPRIGSGTWKNSELSPHIGSGTWKNSQVHPLCGHWDLEERSEVRVVIYIFLPM